MDNILICKNIGFKIKFLGITQTFKLKLQKIKSGKNTLHIFFPDNYEEVGSKLMKNATNQ